MFTTFSLDLLKVECKCFARDKTVTRLPNYRKRALRKSTFSSYAFKVAMPANLSNALKSQKFHLHQPKNNGPFYSSALKLLMLVFLLATGWPKWKQNAT